MTKRPFSYKELAQDDNPPPFPRFTDKFADRMAKCISK